jgi:hypothetical protein
MFKKLSLGGVAFVAALGVGMLIVAPTDAAVTKTKEDCKTAWAVLGPANERGTSAVTEVVDEHPGWSADGYEPMVSQKFALMVFDVEGQDTAAIVAHCGHGATCNQLATEVEQKHADLHDPVVVCTVDPPAPLSNGRSM